MTAEQPAGYLTLPQAQQRVENGKPRLKPSDARLAIRRAIAKRAVAAVMLIDDDWCIVDREQLAHARLDFASSRIEMAGGAPGEAAAPAPIPVTISIEYSTAATLEQPEPSAQPEPPPDIAEPVYPGELLAQGWTIAQRDAIEAQYERRKREHDEAMAAWRAREEQRQAARAAWERRHPQAPAAPATLPMGMPIFGRGEFLSDEEARRAEDFYREQMERAAGVIPEEFTDRASAAKGRHFGPLIVVAEDDIERIADPPPAHSVPAPPPPAALEGEAADSSRAPPGRPPTYDLAAAEAQVWRRIYSYGRPASKGELSNEV